MPPDAKPVIHGLNRQLDILGCLQLDDYEAAASSDSQQIENASVSSRKGGHLGVEISWVELCVEPCGIFANHCFDPSLRGLSIERIVSLLRQRFPIEVEPAQ